MGKYIVRNGVLAGRKFRLEPGARIHIGREKGDLNFPDKRMSRRHCTLEVREEGDFIEDAGSTNGTFVNDEKVKLRHLKPGDVIRVGFTEVEFLGMPEHTSIALTIEPGQRADPNQTIAFRRSDLEAAVAARRQPKGRPRRTSRARSRVDDVKKAAMGLSGGVQLISAKGKFCEACGEAIFMKEGAPDEGRVIDGLYLCRMCALIAEKQQEIGGDFLPSFAKIVSGRMDDQEVPPAADAGAGAVEIVSVEEISLDDLTGEGPGEKAEEKPGEMAETRIAKGAGGEVEEKAEEEVEGKREEKREEKGEEELEEGPAGPAVGEEREERREREKGQEEADPGPGTEKVEAPPHEAEQQAEAESRSSPGPEVEAQPEEKAERSVETGAAAERDISTKDILAAVDAAIEVTEDDPIKPTEEGEAGDGEAGGDEKEEADKGSSGNGGREDGGGPGKPGGDPILPDGPRLAE